MNKRTLLPAIQEIAMPSHLRNLVVAPKGKGEGPREFLFWVVKRDDVLYSGYYDATFGMWRKTRRKGTKFGSLWAARLVQNALKRGPTPRKGDRFTVVAVYRVCLHCKKKLSHECGGKKRFW